ncbi:MAG: hypothetical protein IPN39_01405 [Chitinophagaceae bacterium]|nr:hypothetical protein [Chitinophagaceae bacterium]
MLNYVGIAIVVFISITGGFIHNREYIPDNAKIQVIEEYKIWIPDVEWANQIFQEQSYKNLNAKRVFENKIETTYSQIKSGKYKGFDLPESWKENEGKARIVWGKNESILRSWIFPKKKKWNEDGSWNW